MGLTKKMLEAIELLEKDNFYSYKPTKWSPWESGSFPRKRIGVSTMKSLEERGIVKIEKVVSRKSECEYAIAKLNV